jgi:hypothetical protein
VPLRWRPWRGAVVVAASRPVRWIEGAAKTEMAGERYEAPAGSSPITPSIGRAGDPRKTLLTAAPPPQGRQPDQDQ